MEKVKALIKKMFNSKNKKSIIAVVALVQCLVLIGLTTYSWIESASSLVIKGENIPIAENLNYRFDIDTAENGKYIDLKTYFSPTALYQIAKASSPNGNEFYFSKPSGGYRLGDTTDYNTSYYNFDFYVHNETSKTYNYYFEKAEIFKITSDKLDAIEDAEAIAAAQGAFRIAITVGSNTKIFAYDNTAYNPVNNVNGDTTGSDVTPNALSGNSPFVYSENVNDDNFVFSSTGSGDDTRVNVKIWFEEKDADYLALSENYKKLIEGATVNIDIKFLNAASLFQTFIFDDYTFNTKSGYEGKNVTTEDSTKGMYFYYELPTDTGEVEKVSIPMTRATSTNADSTRWITASDDGVAAPRISDEAKNALIKGTATGYFYYGSSPTNYLYKWPITKPAVNDGDMFVFNALSVHKYNNENTGYGVWDTKETPIKLWEFKDQTTCSTSDVYNANSFSFITNQGPNRLYISSSSDASANVTRMYYDATEGIYKGYFLKNLTDPVFSYTSAADCKSSNIKVQWTASNPTKHNGDTIYKALGYVGSGSANSQSKAKGLGTWAETEEIKFSTELVDASMNKNYRYKIGVKFGVNYEYYYMSIGENATQWKAYVPIGCGNTTDTHIKFQRFAEYNSSSHAGTWNDTGSSIRNRSSIYYATDMNATTSSGQWHIGVVVDGSADNVINDVLTNVTGSKLEYSVDSGNTYIEMKKIDNYRWYTGDFDYTVKKIIYRWTPYPSNNGTSDYFEYGHDLNNGIYFNITE